MSKHRRNNYFPRCWINFPISQNKLSHEQLVFSLLHLIGLFIFLHGYIKFLNHLILSKSIMSSFHYSSVCINVACLFLCIKTKLKNQRNENIDMRSSSSPTEMIEIWVQYFQKRNKEVANHHLNKFKVIFNQILSLHKSLILHQIKKISNCKHCL